MRLHTISYHSIRYRHHIQQAAKVAMRTCVAIVIGFGAYCLAQPYVWAIREAQNEVNQMEIERDSARLSNAELLQVLKGRLAMRNPLGGEYQEFAKVTWTLGEVVQPMSRER